MTLTELRNQTFSLPHRIALYIPSNSNGGDIPAVDSIVDHAADVVRHELATICGGSTALDPAPIREGAGYWIGADGEGVSEDVIIAYAYCEALEPVLAPVLELAQWLKEYCRQEAVSLEIDQEIFFV